MDFRDLLTIRRSVRNFEAKEVPLSVVKEIIADSCEAPNGGHRQPWSFVIVTNKDLMKRLSDESKKNLLQEIERNPSMWLAGYKLVLEKPDFHVFYNAPCLVYIAGPKNIGSIVADCSLAAAYFMLSAADRSLGTCWIDLGSVIRDPSLRREMGMNDDHRIVATIILGYPIKIPERPPRKDPNILKILQ
jgi:nitroreductase